MSDLIPSYSIVDIYHTLFIHVSVEADGHLGRFHLLTIVNNAMNIGVEGSV